MVFDPEALEKKSVFFHACPGILVCSSDAGTRRKEDGMDWDYSPLNPVIWGVFGAFALLTRIVVAWFRSRYPEYGVLGALGAEARQQFPPTEVAGKEEG